ERFRVFVVYLSLIFAEESQDDIGKVFDIILNVSTNIVHLSWLEAVSYVCESLANVFNILECALMTQVYRVGHFVKCLVNERRHDASVRRVRLSRPIDIEWTNSDGLRSVHCR